MRDPRTEEEKQRDVNMMLEPMWWPNPLLPLKRYTDKDIEVGVISPVGSKGMTVVLWNLWDSPDAWEKAERLQYETAWAAVDDGWMVD
jgi:hypothetical protein